MTDTVVVAVPQGTPIVRLLESEIARTSNGEIERTWRWYFTPTNSKTRYLIYETGVLAATPIELHNVSRRHDGVYELFEEANTRYDTQPTQKLYSVRVHIKHLYELYFCSAGDNFRFHAPSSASSLRWMHYRVANDQARIAGMSDLLLELIHCSTRPKQLIMNNEALTRRLLGMRYDHTNKRWFWKNNQQTLMFFDSNGSPPNEQLLINVVKSNWNELFRKLSFPATVKAEEIDANTLVELYHQYVRPEAVLLSNKSAKYLDLNNVNAKQHAGLYSFETRSNDHHPGWTVNALFELHIIDAHTPLPLTKTKTSDAADTSSGQTPISFVTFELSPSASGSFELDGEPKMLHSSQNSVHWYVAPITPTKTALPNIDSLKDVKVLMASTTREMLPVAAHKKRLTVSGRQLLDTMTLLFDDQLGSKKEINFVFLAFEQTAHEQLISGSFVSSQDADIRPLNEQMKKLNDRVVSGMRLANTVFNPAHQPLAIGAYQNNFVRLRNLIAIYCVNVVFEKQTHHQPLPPPPIALTKPIVKMLDIDDQQFEKMLYDRVIVECQSSATLTYGNTQLRTVIARLLNSRTNAARFLQHAMVLDRQSGVQSELEILHNASRWTLATRYDLYDLVNDTDGVFFAHSKTAWLGIAPGLYEQIAFFGSEALTLEAIGWMREVSAIEWDYVNRDWIADHHQVSARVLRFLGTTDRRGSILRRALDVAEKEDRFLAEQRNKRTLSNWAFSNSNVSGGGGGAPKVYTTRFMALMEQWSHSKNETTKRIASYIERQLDTVLAILVKYNSLPGMENRMRLRSPSDIQSAKDNFTLDQLMTALTTLRRAKRMDRQEQEAATALVLLPDSLFPVSLQTNLLDRVYPTLDNQMIIGLLAPIYRYRSMDSKCLSTLEQNDTQDNFIVRKIALADKEQLRFYWMTWFARYGKTILPVGDRRSFADTRDGYRQVEIEAVAKGVRSGASILQAIYWRFERMVQGREITDTEQFFNVSMGIQRGVNPTVWRTGRKPLVESSLEELFDASLGGFICAEDIPNQSLRRVIMTRRTIMYSMPLDTPHDQLPKHTQAQVLELRKMVAYQMWSDEQLSLIESWFERHQESENSSVIFSLSSVSRMPTLERTLEYYTLNRFLSSPRVQGVSLEKAALPLDQSMRDLSRPLQANNTSNEWKLLALQKQLSLWPDFKDKVMRFRVERLSAAMIVTLESHLEDAGRSNEAADQAIEEAIDALKNEYAALLRQIVKYENDQKWENQILALKQHYDAEIQRLKTLAASTLQVFKKALNRYENETTRLVTLFGVTYLDRDVTNPMLGLHDDRFVNVLTKAKARASSALASDIAQAIDESTTALLASIKPLSGTLRKSILEKYFHSPPDTDTKRQKLLLSLTEQHYDQWLNRDTHYGQVLEQLMQRLAKEERQLLVGGDRLDESDRLALLKDIYSRTMIAIGQTPQDGKSEEDYLRLIQHDLLENVPDDRKVPVNRLWSVYTTLLDLVKQPAQMTNDDFVNAFVLILNTAQPVTASVPAVSLQLNVTVVPLLLEKALYNSKYNKHLRYAASASSDQGSPSFGRALMQRNAHLVLALLLAVSKVRASSSSSSDPDAIIATLAHIRELLKNRNETDDLEKTMVQGPLKTNFGTLQSYLDGTIASDDFAVLLSDVIARTLQRLFQSFYNTPLRMIMETVRDLPLTPKMMSGWTRQKDTNVWQTRFFRPLPTECDLTIAAMNTFLGMEPDSSRDRTAISRLLWSKRMEELKQKQLTHDEDNTLCPRPSEKDAAKESAVVAEMLCPRTMRDLALACVRWAMDDFYRTGPNCVDRLPKQLFERLLMSLFESAEFLAMRKRYGLDTHMFDVHPYRTSGTIVSPFYRMRPVAHREAGKHYVYVNEALALRLLNELLQRKQHSLDRLQKLATARYRIESDTVHELWRLVLFGYTSDTYVVVEQDRADAGYFPLYTDDAELLANFICDLDEAIQKAATAIGEKALINYDAMSLIQSVFVFLISFIGSHRTENDIFLQQMHEDGRVLFDYFSPHGIIQLLRDPSTYGLDMVPRALDRHWVSEFVYHTKPMEFDVSQELDLSSRSAFSEVLVQYVFRSDLRPNVVRVLARYERLQDPYDTRSDLASGSGMCFICEGDQKLPWFDVSPLARLDVFPARDGRAIEFPEGRDGSYHPDRSPFPIDQDHSFYEWRIGRQYYLRPELAQNNVINTKKDTQHSDGTAKLVEKLLMLGSDVGVRHLWPEFFVENNWFLQWYEEWIRLVSHSGSAPTSFLDIIKDDARWSDGKSATEWSILPEVIDGRKTKLIADLDKRFQDAKRSIYYETEDITITYEGALAAFKLVLGTVNRFSIQEQLQAIEKQFTDKRSEINLDKEHLDERKYRSLETLVDQFERGAKHYNERLAELGPVLNKRLADVEWRIEETVSATYLDLWKSLTEDPLVETH